MRNLKRIVTVIALLSAVNSAGAWDSTRLAVPVMVNGQVIPYPVFAVYVMPDSVISVGLLDGAGGATVTFDGRPPPNDSLEFRAPSSAGMTELKITNDTTGETCLINVFTMVPASRVGKDGRLNGYRIGQYPASPLRGLDIYRPPAGFVEVTRDNRNVQVSPNFTLGEFLAKQESDYPKYLVLRASLVLKLENILATLNHEGHAVSDFVIMSGYRTPFYNRAIGNVQYSRHVWGGAADFYIDQSPADGRMDDLNKDGRVDRKDAEWLASFINSMSQRGDFGPRIGGIGIYGSTSAHGPFVHVDVRGTRARW